LNLNSSNQKKCTSMNATINSYISLTLFLKSYKCLKINIATLYSLSN
jgi:hypothetical protein